MIFSNQFDIISNEMIDLKIIDKHKGNADEIPYYYYHIHLKATDEQIGKISIRIGHNKHSYFNGNIGYEINEKNQGKKYALLACKMILTVAKYHDMQYLYLTCDASNIASQKIIEHLGARFLEIKTPPKDYIFYYEGISAHKIYQLDI